MARKGVKDYTNISLREEDVGGKIDFEDIFGRNGPVHIEVGSGKGTFLVTAAKAMGEVNFLGIEWANRYYKLAVDRIGRWGIGNVRIIRTDVATFLPEFVADGSVSWFHIYYPDPWPKARHNKRRFICSKNMDEILRCLAVGGVVNIATDHAEYFEQMEEVFGEQVEKGTIEMVEFTRAPGARDGEMVGTNFERKYIVESRKSYTIAGKKL